MLVSSSDADSPSLAAVAVAADPDSDACAYPKPLTSSYLKITARNVLHGAGVILKS